MLLLTRSGVAGARDPIPTLREDATASVRQILDDSDVSTAASGLLASDQRDVLYRRAADAFAAQWQVNSTPVITDLSAPGYELPLEVLFEALDQTLDNGEGSTAPAPSVPVASPVRSPVERVLRHEEKYWAIGCPIDDPDLARACVALATLAGAADNAEADALLSLLPVSIGDHAAAYRRRVTDWLANLYEGTSRLNPLRPDRLGEALISKVLRDEPDGAALLAAVLSLASDDQVAQALEVLTRLTVSDTSAANTATEALTHLHVELLERARDQTRGRPGQPGRLRLANALIRIHSGQLAPRIAAATPAEQIRNLGMTYERLGAIAAQTGQAAEAHRLYTQAFTIRQGLTEAEPTNTTYQRDLSISYERLAALADKEQGKTVATEWFTKALTIRRALNAQEPQRIDLAQELAVCLYLVANSDHGKPEDVERELIDLLSPFEVSGTITVRAAEILHCVRR